MYFRMRGSSASAMSSMATGCGFASGFYRIYRIHHFRKLDAALGAVEMRLQEGT
jgi:hypothetical protein